MILPRGSSINRDLAYDGNIATINRLRRRKDYNGSIAGIVSVVCIYIAVSKIFMNSVLFTNITVRYNIICSQRIVSVTFSIILTVNT